jgi:hypothetical protein
MPQPLRSTSTASGPASSNSARKSLTSIAEPATGTSACINPDPSTDGAMINH